MRLPAWTARVGPVFIAAALVPTLVGALFLAAPRQLTTGVGIGGGGRSTPAVNAHAPAKTVVADDPPRRPCSPVGARVPDAGRANAAINVQGVLGGEGEHVGRRLSLRSAQGVNVVVNLPAESFVGDEPAGGWLLYGVGGRRDSEVRAIDLASGCDTRLARVPGIARGAVLSADGASLYVHVLEAGTRTDLGVSRIDLANDATEQAMTPFTADESFGPVFATTLVLSTDGAALAVQSCGALTCHSRLLDTASGDVSLFDRRHGALVGVTTTHLYAFAAGHERPEALLAIPRDGGEVAVVAEEAYDAELTGSAAEPVLRYETVDGWREVKP